MYTAKIKILPKKGIADPQGEAVKSGLTSLGFNNIKDVKMGKYIEISLDEDDLNALKDEVLKMCEKLLANPVIEDYLFEIKES